MSNGGSAWHGAQRRITTPMLQVRSLKIVIASEAKQSSFCMGRTGLLRRGVYHRAGRRAGPLAPRNDAGGSPKSLARRRLSQRPDRFVFGGGTLGAHQMAAKTLQMLGHFPLGLVDLAGCNIFHQPAPVRDQVWKKLDVRLLALFQHGVGESLDDPLQWVVVGGLRDKTIESRADRDALGGLSR